MSATKREGMGNVLRFAQEDAYGRHNARVEIEHVLWAIHWAVNLGAARIRITVDEARGVLTPEWLPRHAVDAIAQLASDSRHENAWQIEYSDELKHILKTLPREADVRHLYEACYKVFSGRRKAKAPVS